MFLEWLWGYSWQFCSMGYLLFTLWSFHKWAPSLFREKYLKAQIIHAFNIMAQVRVRWVSWLSLTSLVCLFYNMLLWPGEWGKAHGSPAAPLSSAGWLSAPNGTPSFSGCVSAGSRQLAFCRPFLLFRSDGTVLWRPIHISSFSKISEVILIGSALYVLWIPIVLNNLLCGIYIWCSVFCCVHEFLLC